MGLLTGRAGRAVSAAGTGTGTMKMAGQWTDARRAMGRLHRCGPRRPPESSPHSPGGSSSTSDQRASRLSAAALSRAGSVACCAAGFLAAFVALLALPLQAQAQTAGICGRTEQVRTAILAKIPGVSNCADVTDAHLAAITGTLSLGSGITTALATEDFAGLTALTTLHLNGNGLTTLPAGVFDDLIALRLLSLQDNALTTLPDGVFEPLTALIFGSLSGNPGAPFAPEADALPDDGTVPIAGGTVTLDGSDGGPWGTNVTYSWALTNPASGVTVTFDDAASATPVVTIPALTVGTELTFTLTVTGRGNIQGTAPDTDIATVAATDATNTPATGAPAITGTPQVGEVLHVGTSGIMDTDGLTNVSYRHQWLRVNSDGASNETMIGSNAGTYTLVNDDEGKRIRVRVRFTDDAANPETLTSAATGAVAPFPTSSICGRTAEVRDELLYLIEDNEGAAVACADVTAAHLAAITGYLALDSYGITALAAGDFAGLASLTELGLGDNDLSTLPDDVFEPLTALTGLYLNTNDLTTLPAGVFGPLTSLTELYLFDNALSTLPAGVFAGLTALTILDLIDNDLTTLPAGVFAGLTALTELYLDANDLSTLPAGVFAGLTALTELSLFDNDLTTLPAGVFEPLTALTGLNLTDNPGAPFAPEADARPDDGTVPIAGGTVTLDGSGSDGGPWGTNVTYGWALTDPASGVTVTFDDAASATPVVTIPALTVGTELTFTLAVTGRGGTGGIAPATDTAKVTATDANAAPSFTSPATFDAAENQTAVGTVQASDGDADDSVTGYAIQGGADRSKFSIVEATGVLTFAAAPNFEAPADADADNAYVVVVRATSGTGARAKTADQTITVTVTDVAGEAPGVPAAPAVTSASVTSVTAAWTEPANAGPPITDYDYRYRVTSPQGSWTEVTNTAITALSATITGLAEGTEYDVQVRATNDEGTSGWSLSGSGSTDANAAPSFTSAATFDAAENQTAVGTVVASDSDADDTVTGYTIQGGADRSKFSIVEATGVLTFASAPNFEAPADADADNAYVVAVRAASGTGARARTADQTITVTVTDVDSEVPGVPAAPTVSAASESSVMASWTAPATAGPAITDYDYRYRVKAPQGSWTEVTNTAITGLSATIAGLAEDTEYDVQVRATNDEGTSGWSASGSGSTNANNTPATGRPTISGVAQVDSLLTAGKGTIADVNGTTKADNGDSGYAYTYQWIRVDGGTKTNISGATSSTYTPVDDDEGKKIKVRVSFQDDADHSESRTSAATATVTGNDNDNEPALSIADASAAENDGHLLFEVTLSRALQNTVKVDFATISGGTATEGVDYWAHDYTHVIPAGETTVQMGFALIEDTVDDAGETVKVRLSNARRVNAYGDKIKDLDITTAEATGTITAPSTTTTNVPGLTIRIQDATGSEDSGWLLFKVKLSKAYDDYVCYDFETISGGTATEGTDYLKIPKATYWMQIGKKVDKPFVRIIDDSEDDDGETVKVKISNAHLCDDPSKTISITEAEATGTITETSSSGMDSSDDGDGDDALLARVGDVTPEAATAALFGGDALTGDQLAAMDQLGNRNGAYDLGDLFSWRARCQRNEVSCGAIVSATDAGSLPASPAMPPTKRNGRTPPRRRGGARAGRRAGRNMGGSVECVPQRRAMRSGVGRGPGRRGPAIRRAAGWIRALALGLVASAWSCGIGEDLVQPAQPDPGPLHVQLTVPPEARDIGAMLVVEGPGIDSLSAPGFELIQADEASSSRREAIIAGSLSTGPVLQVWVPDRRQLGDYRVQLVQVSGDDYGLEDLTQYGIAISR